MSDKKNLYVGRRISYDGHLCTVRYTGSVQGTKGEWLGVEWDESVRGKHSGEHGGVKYFKCQREDTTSGSFVRPTRPQDKRRSFVEALKEKYAPLDALPGDGDQIRISGKDVEEVGFEKIRQQQAKLQELRVVVLDAMCIGCEDSQTGYFDVGKGVGEMCPKCEVLDLSRNLFESWDEVLAVIRQLPNLRSLRVDGNRFATAGSGAEAAVQGPITSVLDLSVNDCLLSWPQTCKAASCFSNLEDLSATHNLQRTQDDGLIPPTVTTLNLEANEFESLNALRAVASLPSLQRLSLKGNEISRMSDDGPDPGSSLVFSNTVSDLDLSSNAISKWSFINNLPASFPGLTTLRTSKNPLYLDLQAGNGAAMDADDAFMLTLARFRGLTMLNYSKILPKERMDAETYYLAQIGREVAEAPEHDAATILARHPRYTELTSQYGEPTIVRKSPDSLNPDTLAARLVRCKIRVGSSLTSKEKTAASFELEVPRSFSVYNTIGLISARKHLESTLIDIIWETEEPLLSRQDSDSSDSEDEDGEKATRTVKQSMLQMREEVLQPLTRKIGTWLEQPTANLRLERHIAT